jgi:hypothetical protein
MSAKLGRILFADEATVGALPQVIDPRFGPLLRRLPCTGLPWARTVGLRRRRCQVSEGSIEVVESTDELASRVRFRRLIRDCGWVSARDDVKRYVAPSKDAQVFAEDDSSPLLRRHLDTTVWLPVRAEEARRRPLELVDRSRVEMRPT